MTRKKSMMTTSAFAKISGIPAAKISEMIRAGKIKAKKVSGRWQIDKSQLKAKAVAQYGQPRRAAKKTTAAAAAPEAKMSATPSSKMQKADAPATRSAYSVTEFAAMTYLTEKGVMDWLKSGRLKGRMGPNGQWSVDADNLQAADISRLVRD